MVDGERLIDDFDNNSDLYDFELHFNKDFPKAVLGLNKLQPETQPLNEGSSRGRDFRERRQKSFQNGCLEYSVLLLWGVFLLVAGGYLAWRVVQKARAGGGA